MNNDRALEILQLMSDGINPLTGEILPEADLCNQPDIIRALHTAIKVLEMGDKSKSQLQENAGKPWTTKDDETLCQLFDSGVGTKELAARFLRTKGAITSRLARLGKVEHQ